MTKKQKQKIEVLVQRAIENGWALCPGAPSAGGPLLGRADTRLGLCCIRGAIEIGHHDVKLVDLIPMDDERYDWRQMTGNTSAGWRSIGLAVSEVLRLEAGFEGWPDTGDAPDMYDLGSVLRGRYT